MKTRGRTGKEITAVCITPGDGLYNSFLWLNNYEAATHHHNICNEALMGLRAQYVLNSFTIFRPDTGQLGAIFYDDKKITPTPTIQAGYLVIYKDSIRAEETPVGSD